MPEEKTGQEERTQGRGRMRRQGGIEGSSWAVAAKSRQGLRECREPGAVSRKGVRRPAVCFQLCCCRVFGVGPGRSQTEGRGSASGQQ